MAVFVRKNELVCEATFTAADGSNTQPTNAELVVTYTNVNGGQSTDTVPMTVANGVWSAAWDSSNTSGGRVDWMVHCWNGVVAATQGSFEILANSANVA